MVTLSPMMSSLGDATSMGMLNVLGYSDLGDEVTAYAEGTGSSCNAAACGRPLTVDRYTEDTKVAIPCGRWFPRRAACDPLPSE